MNLDNIFKEVGFDSTHHFVESTIHPNSIKQATVLSLFFGTLAVWFENTFGILPIIGLCIVLLFLMEVFTGILASKKNNIGFKSKKFPAGFIKLGVYFVFIGIANMLQNNMPVKAILGYELDYYSFAHYVFLNFVIFQYMISNLENFETLGWNKNIPLLGKIKTWIDFEKIN